MAAAIVAAAVTPAMASAQVMNRQARLEAKKSPAVVAKGFCARVASAPPAERAGSLLADHQKKLKTRRDEVSSFVASRRTSRDGALVQSRGQLKGRRDAALAKMTDKATTPEQQVAVEAFKAAADAAAQARQAAIDAAIKTFRDGLDKARADRQTAVDAALKTFAEAVKATEDKAKVDCGVAGTDPEQVRTAMRTSIEAARTTLRQSIKQAEKVGEAAPALGEARRVAFDKALADYKTALEKAKTDFKAAVSQK
jgi:hypothetical protein